MFVAEGPREVARARAAGLTIAATYFAPALIDWDDGEEVDERVLRKMSYRDEPEGVIAVVEIPQRAIPDDSTLLLVAVGIEKPGNLGAMARTADAAGADALLVADAECDPWNPNAIRASTGSVFSLPIVEATAADVSALPHTKVAATLDGDDKLHRARLHRPDRVHRRRGRRRARRRLAVARRHTRRDPHEAERGGGLAQCEHRRRAPALRGRQAAIRYLRPFCLAMPPASTFPVMNMWS